MREDELQALIVDTAHMLGWRIAHFGPLLTTKGWRTPVRVDGQGFPDLILVRERILAVELKSDTGTSSNDQIAWLHAFRDASVETYLWRPFHWPKAILEVLTRREAQGPARSVL